MWDVRKVPYGIMYIRFAIVVDVVRVVSYKFVAFTRFCRSLSLSLRLLALSRFSHFFLISVTMIVGDDIFSSLFFCFIFSSFFNYRTISLNFVGFERYLLGCAPVYSRIFWKKKIMWVIKFRIKVCVCVWFGLSRLTVKICSSFCYQFVITQIASMCTYDMVYFRLIRVITKRVLVYSSWTNVMISLVSIWFIPDIYSYACAVCTVHGHRTRRIKWISPMNSIFIGSPPELFSSSVLIPMYNCTSTYGK